MDWKEHGVRIIHAGELDMNTLQTSGMTRAAAVTRARAGAEKLWAGTMVVQPDAKTGPHHHGELETVLYHPKRCLFRCSHASEGALKERMSCNNN